MLPEAVQSKGLVLLGCGKMGGAMLEGWLKAGLPPASVYVLEPRPSDRLLALAHDGLHLNSDFPATIAICVIAIKPQSMTEALPALRRAGNGSAVFLSIAAGTPIAAFEAAFGDRTPVIRAMPNTPAAIGKGITALIGSRLVTEAQMRLAEVLLQTVGQTVRLENEGQMDAVTALSGSGPAYVFHLIETMAAAGVTAGLEPELSMKLAVATVAGAGALAEVSADDPAQLRVNVTSPGGTTAAALAILMDKETGFPLLLQRAVAAALTRSKELA